MVNQVFPFYTNTMSIFWNYEFSMPATWLGTAATTQWWAEVFGALYVVSALFSGALYAVSSLLSCVSVPFCVFLPFLFLDVLAGTFYGSSVSSHTVFSPLHLGDNAALDHILALALSAGSLIDLMPVLSSYQWLWLDFHPRFLTPEKNPNGQLFPGGNSFVQSVCTKNLYFRMSSRNGPLPNVDPILCGCSFCSYLGKCLVVRRDVNLDS